MSASGNFSRAALSALFSSITGTFLSLWDLLSIPKDRTNFVTDVSAVALSSRFSACHHLAPGKLSICKLSAAKGGSLLTLESPMMIQGSLTCRCQSFSFLRVLGCLVGVRTCCSDEAGEGGEDDEEDYSSAALIWSLVCLSYCEAGPGKSLVVV